MSDFIVQHGRLTPQDIADIEKDRGELKLSASFTGQLISNFLPKNKIKACGGQQQILASDWIKVRQHLITIKALLDE